MLYASKYGTSDRPDVPESVPLINVRAAATLHSLDFLTAYFKDQILRIVVVPKGGGQVNWGSHVRSGIHDIVGMEGECGQSRF
jgi:hypothetical protein